MSRYRAPQTTDEVLIEKVESLQEDVKLMRSVGPTTIPTVDNRRYNNPTQGEIVVTWRRRQVAFYHDGRWYYLGGAPLTPFRKSGGTGQTVVSAPCELSIWAYGNPNSFPIYVHLYDSTATTGTPAQSHFVPRNSGANVIGHDHLEFLVALSVKVTTDIAATAVVSSCVVNLGYILT